MLKRIPWNFFRTIRLHLVAFNHPRLLERLVIRRFHSKGSTFPSVILKPWELVRPVNLALAVLEANDSIWENKTGVILKVYQSINSQDIFTLITVIRCFCFNRAIVRSALSFVQKTRSVLPTIKTTLQNANVVMLLDIRENHAVSIMSNAFTSLPLYIDWVLKYPHLDQVK